MAPTDEQLRQGVRDRLEPWIKKLQCGGDVEKQWYYKRRFLEGLRSAQIAIETDKANEQHYEVPTKFFLTVLGERLKYSGCIWSEDTKTLEEAEDASLAQICERARIEDGQAVMDLGCGWGALALYVCEKFPACRVTAVSNSATQRELIQARAEQRGFSGRLEVITEDANVFVTDQRFDRIVSIEMFEHMKNYERLFQRVSSWLKPHGMLFTQVLCHKEFAYNFNTSEGSDTEWMAKNFFSGGTMPSADLFLYFQNDVTIVDHWRINGKNYSKTLEAWLRLLDERKDKVTEILNEAYGAKDGPKHLFNWRLFFIFCSEVFGYEDGNQWVLAHHLFKKKPTLQL